MNQNYRRQMMEIETSFIDELENVLNPIIKSAKNKINLIIEETFYEYYRNSDLDIDDLMREFIADLGGTAVRKIRKYEEDAIAQINAIIKASQSATNGANIVSRYVNTLPVDFIFNHTEESIQEFVSKVRRKLSYSSRTGLEGSLAENRAYEVSSVLKSQINRQVDNMIEEVRSEYVRIIGDYKQKLSDRVNQELSSQKEFTQEEIELITNMFKFLNIKVKYASGILTVIENDKESQIQRVTDNGYATSDEKYGVMKFKDRATITNKSNGASLTISKNKFNFMLSEPYIDFSLVKTEEGYTTINDDPFKSETDLECLAIIKKTLPGFYLNLLKDLKFRTLLNNLSSEIVPNEPVVEESVENKESIEAPEPVQTAEPVIEQVQVEEKNVQNLTPEEANIKIEPSDIPEVEEQIAKPIEKPIDIKIDEPTEIKQEIPTIEKYPITQIERNGFNIIAGLLEKNIIYKNGYLYLKDKTEEVMIVKNNEGTPNYKTIDNKYLFNLDEKSTTLINSINGNVITISNIGCKLYNTKGQYDCEITFNNGQINIQNKNSQHNSSKEQISILYMFSNLYPTYFKYLMNHPTFAKTISDLSSEYEKYQMYNIESNMPTIEGSKLHFTNEEIAQFVNALQTKKQLEQDEDIKLY